MTWSEKKEEDPDFHDHTMHQYRKRRVYMPDYVSREEWGAEPPWDKGDDLPHPVKDVNVYYTETAPCNSLSECAGRMRELQKTHIDMGLMDISWNFVVGGDGRKYEGRGWMLRPEKPWEIKKKKKKYLSIGIVGNLQSYEKGPTEYIQDAIEDLIHFGICNKYIYCCYDTKRELLFTKDTRKTYRV